MPHPQTNLDLTSLGIPTSLSSQVRRTPKQPVKEMSYLLLRRKEKSISSDKLTMEEIYEKYAQYDKTIYHQLRIGTDAVVYYQRDEIFIPTTYKHELSQMDGIFVPIISEIISPLLPESLRYPVVFNIPSSMVTDDLRNVSVFKSESKSVQVALSFTADIRKGIAEATSEHLENLEITMDEFLGYDLQLVLIELNEELTPEQYKVGKLYLLVPINDESDVYGYMENIKEITVHIAEHINDDVDKNETNQMSIFD